MAADRTQPSRVGTSPSAVKAPADQPMGALPVLSLATFDYDPGKVVDVLLGKGQPSGTSGYGPPVTGYRASNTPGV
jgi:hypothetical protein